MKFNPVGMSDTLARFLTQADQYSAPCVAIDGPLKRPVDFNPETWLNWFGEHSPAKPSTAPSHRGADPVALTARLDHARSVVREILTDSNGQPKVGRADLLRLATDYDRNPNDETITKLWVAMIWGSGRTNGRGPRYARMSLTDPRLLDTLIATHRHVRDSEMSLAYDTFRVDGVGPSFFTKWFWVSSLTIETDKPAGLILDKRVRASLWRLQTSDKPFVPRGGAGYADYIEVVHAIAAVLADRFPNLNAEKLEWLLFERTRSSEPRARALYEWLG